MSGDDLDSCTCDEDTPLRVYPGPDGERHGMRCPVVNQGEHL